MYSSSNHNILNFTLGVGTWSRLATLMSDQVFGCFESLYRVCQIKTSSKGLFDGHLGELGQTNVNTAIRPAGQVT